MRTETTQPTARGFVEELAASGRYHFTTEQVQTALGVSHDAVRFALHRLAKRGLVAAPVRGFYVVVPPEYRRLGCLPADQFVPALMAQFGLSYYAGLLTAAEYYGAAHQRPQEFQVLLERNRRPIVCGAVRVGFVARKWLQQVPTRTFNTLRGVVQVSTPEATALDLAGYPGHAGGLDQVTTVLSELSAEIEPQRLVEVARTAPVTWAQRLGYLLDVADASDRTGPLKAYVNRHVRDYTPLSPETARDDAPRSRDWKLIVNAAVEPDL